MPLYPAPQSVRPLLTAARTYYVRTDGNDANDGLANTAGGAFLTIQKALDTAAGLDFGIFSVTINVADGTYTAGGTVKPWAGFGQLVMTGNTTTPANVIINAAANCFVCAQTGHTAWLRGFKLSGTSGAAFVGQDFSFTQFSDIEFGACGTAHISLSTGATVQVNAGAYNITGAAPRHLYMVSQSRFLCTSKVMTLTGTPNFSVAFARCEQLAFGNLQGTTYSGAATGKRYDVREMAMLSTGAATLPGDVAGTVATGGTYA